METADLPAFDSLRISTKKSPIGHQSYVIAYKNKWDPVKKQSRKLHREYIGMLEDSGLVKISEGFIKKGPEFANWIVKPFPKEEEDSWQLLEIKQKIAKMVWAE